MSPMSGGESLGLGCLDRRQPGWPHERVDGGMIISGRVRVFAVPLLLAVACTVAACDPTSAGADAGSPSASAPGSPAQGSVTSGTVSASPSGIVTPTGPFAIAVPGGLAAVAVTSASDAWAIGGTMIVHWDGSRWREIPNPVAGEDVLLRSVAATSAGDAWAVGFVRTGATAKNTIEQRTFIEHWDGRAWSQVPSPPKGNLLSVAATSPHDAWAVGDSAFLSPDLGHGGPPLIEHWDGKSWTVTPSPKVAGGYLISVAAIAAGDAWAVGSTGSGALIEHWEGRFWTQVTSPVVADATLAGVAAVSASDAWAVGYIGDRSSQTCKGLVEHWNGRAWKVVPSPGFSGAALVSVAAVSASDAWAVGSDRSGDPGAGTGNVPVDTVNSKTLIEHWDGKAWRRVPSPSGSDAVDLAGVAAVSASYAWAVGTLFSTSTSESLALTEHWGGKAWS